MGKRISVGFPKPSTSGSDVLVQVDLPFEWPREECRTEKLIEILGFLLETEKAAEGTRISLVVETNRHSEAVSPALIPPERLRESMGRIFDQLDYGLIHFSAIGEIVAASPSILEHLKLAGLKNWSNALAEAIPLSFYNDVIWGQVLANGDGAFENFRIRVHPPGAHQKSILFNVSGFRDAAGSIPSLWQIVSEQEGTEKLSEGSILSGMRIHNITRHYVPQMVEQKARDAVRQGKTSLTNEERRVAVLFCDIVGFTSYVERNASSESIVDTLNFILRRVSRSVTQNHGFIDKFMGDSIMALFDDPADAIFAAIDMQSHSEDLNRLRFRAGQQTLQLRIGIHWGDVIICNVGTVERMDWTAIGDVVNTASRIEKGCEPGSILISAAMRNAVEGAQPGQFRFGQIFGLQAKGKRDEIAVCDVSLASK